MAFDVDVFTRGAVSFLTGALYVGVGRVILSRDLAPSARTANRLFGTWWIGLAILYLTSGPFTMAASLGYRSFPLSLAFIQSLLVVLCVAMWGILGFLIYVYRGTHTWLVPTGIFYGALAFAMLWLIAWMEPVGFEDATSISLHFTNRLGAGSSAILGLLFSVPIFLAAIAYATLLFRVTDKAPRFRIAMVSGAFALQFGWGIVQGALGLNRRFPDSALLLVITQGVAILMPLVILMAYRPPRWIARRLAASS